jgi:hypothetical protein
MLESLPRAKARILIDQLRKGIPPSGYVEAFTIGRDQEIEWLADHLDDEGKFALLLKANYGSGKSHLLQLIREKALKDDHVLSSVVLDARSGVRFNRLDQIFGAIMRGVETALPDDDTGDLETFLDFLARTCETARDHRTHFAREFWEELTNGWKWDYSETLTSPPLYIALRAWITSTAPARKQLILDWLRNPESYEARRTYLYGKLIGDLGRRFKDPRPERQFYSDGLFSFKAAGYVNCWFALEDLQTLAVNSGLPGVVILFDEFEDVITNLRNVGFQETAFVNLFQFVSGNKFSGKTFYAVTPAFTDKCKQLLLNKGRYGFDFARFDKLPTFAMSPLGGPDMQELAKRIIVVHERAFEHHVSSADRDQVIAAAGRAGFSTVADRTRQAIKQCVEQLDALVE